MADAERRQSPSTGDPRTSPRPAESSAGPGRPPHLHPQARRPSRRSRVAERRAFGDDRSRELAARRSRTGGRKRGRVNTGRVGVIEAERRRGWVSDDVGVVERTHGADIRPVADESRRARRSWPSACGMISRPKSTRRPVEQRRAAPRARRRKSPSRPRTAGPAAVVKSARPPAARSSPSPSRRARFGFSSKPSIRPCRSKRKMPMLRASSMPTGWAAMVMSAPARRAPGSSREVHAIQMVAGEDQVVVGVERHEMRHRPAHGVGGALEPVRVLGRLFGGEDLDEGPARSGRAGRSDRCAG